MAARENQGYLIAVIILVLLTLVLALAAFLGLSKAGENSTSRLAAEHKLLVSNTLGDAYRSKARILEAFAGDFGPTVAEVETEITILNGLAATQNLEASERALVQEVHDRVLEIQAVYEKDMLGSNPTEEGAPVQQQTWRSRIQSLTALVAKKNNENKIADSQTKLAEAEAASKIQRTQTLLETNQKTLNETSEQLAAEKRRSIEKENELKSSLDAAVTGNENVNKELQAYQQSTAKTISEITNERNEFEIANEGLKTRINGLTREVFDGPDGSIVKVASRLKSVFINLGSEDGLPANETFSIYDQDEINFKDGQHKAKIEVTRIYPYRAEARITEEDPTNPILTGDHILTATWDPGVSVPYAVVGTFDLDGDRYDDREKLIQIIERNGGKVVATHDDEGNMIGKIDFSVRYIVIGDPPSLVEDAKLGQIRNSSAIQKTMREMQEIAEKNTVDKIDLQKLLNKMGVRAKPKTLQIESRIGGFPTREASDAAAGKNNN